MIEISSDVFIAMIAIIGALFLHSLIIYTLREVQELSYANAEIAALNECANSQIIQF